MKPILVCCTPFRRPWPSGWGWTHSKSCSVDPGQKVRPTPLAPASDREARRLRLVHKAEDARAGIAVGHPAGKGSWGHAVGTWMDHATSCDCVDCLYVEAHLDDAR